MKLAFLFYLSPWTANSGIPLILVKSRSNFLFAQPRLISVAISGIRIDLSPNSTGVAGAGDRPGV